MKSLEVKYWALESELRKLCVEHGWYGTIGDWVKAGLPGCDLSVRELIANKLWTRVELGEAVLAHKRTVLASEKVVNLSDWAKVSCR